MKKTLITIALTTVIVLTLVGIASSLFIPLGSAFSTQSRSLGMGGGGGGPEYYAEEPASVAMEAPAPVMDSIAMPMAGNGGDAKSLSNALNQPGSVNATQERLVIQNVDLAIVVKDPKKDMKRINDLANEMGGYVVASNLYQSYTQTGLEVPEASITIRIPSEKLDDALEKVKTGVVDVQYENRSGQDVTNQYVDLQSQLKAKQAAEKKLLEIMDKAEKAEDVLAIYLQVESVQTQIEMLKGQIKYFEESAALSAISIRLIAEEGTQPIEIGPWKPEGAAKEAVQDLIYFFQNFVDFLIRFVLYNLPALILGLVPLYLLYLGGRAIFRRMNRSKVKTEQKEEVKK
jgi:hypothetical protein